MDESLIGIDFGLKRVGIAASDAGSSLAFPLDVLLYSKGLASSVCQLAAERGATKIVLGESKNYQGEENAIMKQAKEFAEVVQKTCAIDVVWHPEYLTSAQAMRGQEDTDKLDASAAAIILQSYIDSDIQLPSSDDKTHVEQIVIDSSVVSYTDARPRDERGVVVLLHGWGSNKEIWNGVIATLMSAQYRAVAIDLPGFGSSDAPRYPFGVAEYSHVVRAIIRELRIENHALVGHSFGGQVALHSAARAGEKLSHLVLAGAAVMRNENPSLVARLASIAGKLIPQKHKVSVRKKARTLLGAEVVGVGTNLEPTLEKVLRDDMSSLLPLVETPTLVVWGEADEDTPLSEGKLIAESMNNATLKVYKGVGHYTFIEEPARFASDVITFLHTS